MLDDLKSSLVGKFAAYKKDDIQTRQVLLRYVDSFTNLLATGLYIDPHTSTQAKSKKSSKGEAAPVTKAYGLRRKKATQKEQTRMLGYIAYLAQKAHEHPELDENIRAAFAVGTTYGKSLKGPEYDYKIKHEYLVCMAYDYMKAALHKQFDMRAFDTPPAVVKVLGGDPIADAIPSDLMRAYVQRLNVKYHDGRNDRDDYIAGMERGEYYQLRDRIDRYFSTFEDEQGTFGLQEFLPAYEPMLPSHDSGASYDDVALDRLDAQLAQMRSHWDRLESSLGRLLPPQPGGYGEGGGRLFSGSSWGGGLAEDQAGGGEDEDELLYQAKPQQNFLNQKFGDGSPRVPHPKKKTGL